MNNKETYYTIEHPIKGNLCIQGLYGLYENALNEITRAREIHGPETYIKCHITFACTEDKKPLDVTVEQVATKVDLNKYRS